MGTSAAARFGLDQQNGGKPMTKLGLLGATAVVLLSALAGSAMAQQVIANPGYCAQFYPDANCQNKGPANPYTGDYQRRLAHSTDSSVSPGPGSRAKTAAGIPASKISA
jgi:hypothetical protein